MKKDDIVAVDISGQKVQDGKVKSVDWENGQVTIVIPATEVVMAFRTQLDAAATAPKPVGGTEHAILGVEDKPVSVETPTGVVEGVPLAPVETPVTPPVPVENKEAPEVVEQSESAPDA